MEQTRERELKRGGIPFNQTFFIADGLREIWLIVEAVSELAASIS